MFNLHRLLKRLVLRTVFEEGGGGGAPVETVAPAAEISADVAAPEVAAPTEPAGPKTMLEAMFARDEKGRFATKPEAEPGAAPAPLSKPAETAKVVTPTNPDDIAAMPEGLGPKAQERFQKLATVNRELTERTQQLDTQVSYVRDTFQQHGIQREQFEQATQVIGALNRGDFAAAQQMLTEQLRQVSLMTGQTMPGVDALSDFPDLRQKVDQLQISEQDAMEVARLRASQSAVQGHYQQERQQRLASEQQQQTFNTARAGVDAWVKDMAAKDLDWPVIEEQLLPDLKGLLADVPPGAWVNVLQAQYNVLKRASTAFRRTAAPVAAINPLRPMGAGAPHRTPTTMHEAMFGTAGRS